MGNIPGHPGHDSPSRPLLVSMATHGPNVEYDFRIASHDHRDHCCDWQWRSTLYFLYNKITQDAGQSSGHELGLLRYVHHVDQ